MDGNLLILIASGAQRAWLFDNGGRATACHQHRSVGGVQAACEPCVVGKRYTQVPTGYIGSYVGDGVLVVCKRAKYRSLGIEAQRIDRRQGRAVFRKPEQSQFCRRLVDLAVGAPRLDDLGGLERAKGLGQLRYGKVFDLGGGGIGIGQASADR